MKKCLFDEQISWQPIVPAVDSMATIIFGLKANDLYRLRNVGISSLMMV